MMNNFMASNLPQAFYNCGPDSKNTGSNYSYDIDLNAVKKSLGGAVVNNGGTVGQSQQPNIGQGG